MTQPLPPTDLAAARAHLRAADAALAIWHTKLPDDGEGGYWDGGERALLHIDEATRELYHRRIDLVCAMNADDAERRTRVRQTMTPFTPDDEGQAPARVHVDMPAEVEIGKLPPMPDEVEL